MIQIKKQKEEYVAGLAGIKSCPCIFSVKDGILTLELSTDSLTPLNIRLLSQDVEITFQNLSSINSGAVAGGALLGSMFGTVGAVLGGVGGSNVRDNTLTLSFKFNGYDSIMYFKPSPTIADLYNQLLLFKQENVIVDFEEYDLRTKEQERLNFLATRYLIGVILILAGINRIIELKEPFTFLSGIVLIPPTFPYLEKRFNLKLYSILKKMIFWGLLILAGYVSMLIAKSENPNF